MFYFLGVYALGYFALRQKEVFPYMGKDAEAVGEIMQDDKPVTNDR